MKKLLAITLMTMFSTFAAFAQNGKAEQEILKIHKSLDQAYLNKDTVAFERIMADDYSISGVSGKMQTRAEAMADLRKEFVNADYKVLSATTDDVKIKVLGNMALVTGNWTSTTVSAKGTAEPHTDTGRFSNIYEKRDSKWMLVAEHWTEAQHDRKLMKEQVLKIGQEYTRMIKSGNVAALDKIMADEFLYTDDRGKLMTKAEDLARYKSDPITYEIFEISDQKVNVLGNNSAVETGTVRFKGTNKDGKLFDGSDRYTTTWVWRDGRWQIVADHTSEIKK